VKAHLPNLSAQSLSAQPAPRSGATLVEVLMSLLILGLGVVPIFTLFPLTLLSSVKATHNTSARLFADQVAATLRHRPELVLCANQWTPRTPFNAKLVTPTYLPGTNSPRSLYYFYSPAGTSGSIEPDWRTTFEDGDITWQSGPMSIPIPPGAFPLQNRFAATSGRYVVDPYGALVNNGTPLQYVFGNDNGNPVGTDPLVLRVDAGITNETQAIQSRFTSSDTWSTVETYLPIAANTIDTSTPADGIVDSCALTFGAEVDITGMAANGLSRVVVTSPDGKQSRSATIIGASGNALIVNSPLFATTTTPEDITGAIGKVRIEFFERKFTWLGAVHRDPAGARIQCAIFYNRSLRLEDEQLYEVSSQPSADTVTYTIPSGKDPFAPEGGYVFDATMIKFHKIIDSSKGLFSNQISVSPAFESTNLPRRLIFMPGIVQVYEMTL